MTETRIRSTTWLAIALVVAIALLAVFGAVSMANSGGYYGMMGGGTGWAMLFMGLPVVVLLVVLVLALGGTGDRSAYEPYYSVPSPTPLGVLEERYARGELSRDEYLRIRRDLTQGHH